MTFHDNFLNLCDELGMAISQGDALMKLVDVAIIDIEVHVEGEPFITTNHSSAPVE